MADAYLERMGRELKCPICLSLLNSAISLTCNHVFCNSCIEKSMKSASNCPVCKVPYRRREIRPAPHMDNLVSVYKSMEAASGVNIFVTQNAALTKISGEGNERRNKIQEIQDNAKVQLETSDGKNQKLGYKNGSKRQISSDKGDFALNSSKPSFPAKKRVQVPVHPISKAQMQPENLEQEVLANDAGGNPTLQKDIPSACEKVDPLLSPFFWLREEDEYEKSSQQTDGNQIMYTPPEIPCFSDIKDSDGDDDDNFCNISPKSGTCIQSDKAEFFDSEIFDWTQRPCSPELCLSPKIVHVDNQNDVGGLETATTAGVKASLKKRKPKPAKVTPVNTSKNKHRARMPLYRVSDATEARESKRTKRTTSSVAEVHGETQKIVNSAIKDKMLNLKQKSGKNKKPCSVAVQEIGVENVQNLSDGSVPVVNSNGSTPVTVFPSEGMGKNSDMSNNLKKPRKCGKGSMETSVQLHKYDRKFNDRKLSTQKAPAANERCSEILISRSNSSSLPICDDKEISDNAVRRKTCEEDRRKGPKSLNKVKFSIEGMPKDNCNSIPSRCSAAVARRGKKSQELQDNDGQIRTKVPAHLDTVTSTLNGSVLLKCTASQTLSVHCAFCQASEESEASGNMVHYLNGKRLDGSDKTISNALHVHKNCAEWSPNVYFEDDNVINLEAEISRSRRIRCSCCGIKGAALGCYEKSCRKSFHVTCANLTPECRWDYENFVMLCPIHASCPLPNEMQKSQSNQKRKCAVKSKTGIHQAKTTNECNIRSNSNLELQKRFKNVVFCCSALTITEKGIVSEFENLSGVAALKNWDSSVTHIVASTDENGACRRTLKFLMGVLEGKWILSVHWLKACIEAGELVDEQPYEIAVDIHGIRDGPRLGRLRFQNKQPKLFDGCKFFFANNFSPSYKGYLHDLITAAGGKVLNRKPVVENEASPSFIIYSLELPEKCRPSDASSILNRRRADAEALATSTGSTVASNSWILNSIAGHKLQDCGE